MTDLPDKDLASNLHIESTSNSVDSDSVSFSSEHETDQAKSSKTSSWSSLFLTAFSVFEVYSSSTSTKRKETKARTHVWSAAMRKAIACGSMRRLQERVMGSGKTDITSSDGEVWLLGICYKMSSEPQCSGAAHDDSYNGFLNDFSSRIWMTYRKGFDTIDDSKFTSDVGWGCMIRSSQMLVAQALLFHCFGRTWRKSLQKPYDPKYIELLHQFGDSKMSAFSIHNLLQAGRSYGLAAGSWVGPYAMCRSWEALARTGRNSANVTEVSQSLPMAIYVVSGDEDGERGGAPVLCIDTASKISVEYCKGQATWAPLLLLVPLVLGLDKVNPRYISLLWTTFTFPQSLGILGGKPGASTYMIGVQDDKALYLDPHEVQPVVDIKEDNLEADTSSYHCSTVRQLPLEQIDPSLAIGFYCQDKGLWHTQVTLWEHSLSFIRKSPQFGTLQTFADDFDDFCARAIDLVEQSEGAPLFTVAASLPHPKSAHHDGSSEMPGSPCKEWVDPAHVDYLSDPEAHQQEDDWQLL